MKLEAAARKLESITARPQAAQRPEEPLPLRRGAIREGVIEVLMQADGALAPLEVRRRAAGRVGRSLKQHTVTAMLGHLVNDPEVPVMRISPARYARVADGQQTVAPLSPRKEAVKERVLAVLAASSEPMRPTEVWAAVDAQEGESIAYDTVAGFLSLAARHPDVPVERVKQGWYAAPRSDRACRPPDRDPPGDVDSYPS